ncbi:dTMP kinase [Halovenus marina]|uniref:dTMP kinase n=1 Tax=Halovenus marina TaxID=3396621 RepID=UPI003F553762
MLITLEGLDGSGKTTCRAALESAFPDVTFTREPTDSWYGDAVRQSINTDDADPLAELFLYTADHAAHISETIEPALDRGETIVSDRYSDSRYAYQGATLADRFEDALAYVREIHQPWTRPPDKTIYLDIDPETAAARSGATNKFETAQALEPVRDNYERLIDAEPDRFVRIDATQPEANLKETVVETVAELPDR